MYIIFIYYGITPPRGMVSVFAQCFGAYRLTLSRTYRIFFSLFKDSPNTIGGSLDAERLANGLYLEPMTYGERYREGLRVQGYTQAIIYGLHRKHSTAPRIIDNKGFRDFKQGKYR